MVVFWSKKDAGDGAAPEVASEDTGDGAAGEDASDAAAADEDAGEAGDAEAPDGVSEGVMGARGAARPRREDRRSPEAVQEPSGAIHLTGLLEGRRWPAATG